MTVKDKIGKYRFPGIVHKIPCTDCDYRYIGESVNFESGLRDDNVEVSNKKIASDALAECVEATTHKIAWEEISVTTTENKWL